LGKLDIEYINLECPEFKKNDVEEIAREKARFAFEYLKKPLIVDDTALHIAALKGFPGPYAAYVLNTLGTDGILKLMDKITDTKASFVTAIAYADGDDIKVFTGSIDGYIVQPRGTGGFGYDPIFEYKGRTLAELPLHEKNTISHRGRALTAFMTWLLNKKSTKSHKS